MFGEVASKEILFSDDMDIEADTRRIRERLSDDTDYILDLDNGDCMDDDEDDDDDDDVYHYVYEHDDGDNGHDDGDNVSDMLM